MFRSFTNRMRSGYTYLDSAWSETRKYAIKNGSCRSRFCITPRFVKTQFDRLQKKIIYTWDKKIYGGQEAPQRSRSRGTYHISRSIKAYAQFFEFLGVKVFSLKLPLHIILKTYYYVMSLIYICTYIHVLRSVNFLNSLNTQYLIPTKGNNTYTTFL